jgi:hypothetical protein
MDDDLAVGESAGYPILDPVDVPDPRDRSTRVVAAP